MIVHLAINKKAIYLEATQGSCPHDPDIGTYLQHQINFAITSNHETCPIMPMEFSLDLAHGLVSHEPNASIHIMSQNQQKIETTFYLDVLIRETRIRGRVKVNSKPVRSNINDYR